MHVRVESSQPEELDARAGEPLRTRVLEERVAVLQREVAQLRGREASWRAERTRLLAALETAERELAELPAIRHEADVNRATAYWLAVVQSSLSWRLTRRLPPRSATGRAGRHPAKRRVCAADGGAAGGPCAPGLQPRVG